MKCSVRLVRTTISYFAQSEATPSVCLRFCQIGLTFSKKNANTDERTLVVYHVKIGYVWYALLVDICYRNPMFDKYSLHNLYRQSIKSHFLTLFLN